MRARMLSCGLWLGAALCAAVPATAADLGPPSPGAILRNMVVLDGKQVPLPAGDWLVAGTATADFDGARLGAFGRMRQLVLFQVDGGAVSAVAEITTNILPTSDGWGISRDCARSDMLMAVTRFKAGWDAACLHVAHTLPGAAVASAAWSAAADRAARQGWHVPPVLLTAGFRVADRADVVDLRLHMAPSRLGAPADPAPTAWRDSPWHVRRIAEDAPRKAAAETLGRWALGFDGLVAAGLRNHLDPAAPAVDLPMGDASPPPPRADDLLAARAAALTALRDGGLIDAATHDAQRARLEAIGRETGSAVADPATVALYKTLSYRPIVSALNLGIDLYWIGRPFAAGVLEVLQIVVNSYKFYMHELAWSRFIGAANRPDTARQIDFASLGTNS
jgi:uncharacterized membrane protein